MKLAGVLVSDVSPMLVGYNHWVMVGYNHWLMVGYNHWLMVGYNHWLMVGYNHWLMVGSRWFTLPALTPLHPLTYTAKGTYHKT